MKTSVTDTSLFAYDKLLNSKAEWEKAVFDLIVRSPQPMTIREIADYYGKHPNEISGRIGGLRNRDLVEEKFRRKCRSSGNVAKVWGLTDKGRNLLIKINGPKQGKLF